MELQIKILIALLVIVILLFSAAYIVVAVKGRPLLTQRLEDVLDKRVSIGSLGLKLPLGLWVRHLRIEGLGEIDCIYVFPDLPGLLRGKIILNEVKILNPQISLSKGLSDKETADIDLRRSHLQKEERPLRQVVGEKTFLVGTIEESPFDEVIFDESVSRDEEAVSLPVVQPDLPVADTVRKQHPTSFTIKHLRVEHGVINFIDKLGSEPQEQVNLLVKDVYFDLKNLCLLPQSAVTRFELKGTVVWQGGLSKGTIYACGWADFHKKDIQARLEIKDIDAIPLYPYYSNWVDLENARIEKAVLNFTSDIQGENNEVLARCCLELTDIQFRPRPADETKHKAQRITFAVLDIFRELNQGKVILNFTVKTNMDKPGFKFESISSAIDEKIAQARGSNGAKIEEVALLPGRLVEDVAKGAGGVGRAIIDGAVSIGRSVTEAILDVLGAGDKESKEIELQEEKPAEEQDSPIQAVTQDQFPE